ncbi:MAG: glucokinase, partial [Hydrogenophaga sp.]|nr:glucokinase [Hydrogenophaga sp.]
MPQNLAPAPFPRLLADVGGTNARFAWQAEPAAAISDVRVLRCADHPTLQAAMHAYLTGLDRGRPAAAAIAIANPITGDAVHMTNHHWSQLLNDFTALALALPDLPASELRQVGGGEADPDSAIALLGAGTGLGVSGLLPDRRGGWLPINGEGGHVTLPAVSPRERLLMDGLIRLYGRA